MWNIPNENRVRKIPRDTSKVMPLDHVVHLHFFLGGSDWYAIEYNPARKEFFGFVILNGDTQNSEFGYFSFQELIDLRTKGGVEVDCELAKYWPPTKITEIHKLEQLCTHLRG